MEIIAIDKNIPIPTTKCGSRSRTAKYPWKDMEVGDSFLVAGPNAPKKGLSAQASINGKRFDREFITRSVDGGLRIWRTK